MARKVKAPTDARQKAAWLAFQELPNIGPAMAEDFVRLGLRSLDDLGRADPKELYDRISKMDGVRHDPCVLDTYEAAVHNLRTGAELPWWEFSRRRKQG
ncbi:MAG TPA: helix-hairpin-helix domain-containing protein [Candidatus Thermoplasmatota archaeon]|nr:helix-hairpin-helix domain-containing protein [Candidatus Thermoplasmatota archaeon]